MKKYYIFFKEKWFIAIFAFFLLFLISIISYRLVFYEKIYPGIYLGKIYLGGKTLKQAREIIQKRIDKIIEQGFTFSFEKNVRTISGTNDSVNSDLSYQLVDFNTDKALVDLYKIGRKDKWYKNLIEQYNCLVKKCHIYIEDKIKEKEILYNLKDKFSSFENPAKSAELELSGNKFIINEEKLGSSFRYKTALKQLKKQLSQLDNRQIELLLQTKSPEITKKDINSKLPLIYSYFKVSPINFNYQNKQWKINKKQILNYLELVKLNNNIKIKLNKQNLTKFLKQISQIIDKKPKNAKFQIKNGKVSQFQLSLDGKKLNIEKTINLVQKKFIENHNPNIELAVEAVAPEITTDNINNLGIKEIIGVGSSNFAGSPANREHNIRVGANTLNGILIKPQEEFSLIKALGEIGKETNYLSELVIKQGRTIPEYGGGLCQIGTTMFRAAINSGLLITERQNHSYNVSYYKPAGSDATIYSPHPDFRFINDTKNYILIQSKIIGKNLYFYLWGTKDGRKIETNIDKPIVYNITKPGPTKFIQTTELSPGEKKCIEHAHNGLDAYFNYKVIYADGKIRERKIYSHYRPWRKVCLVGVKKIDLSKKQ